MQQKQCGLRGEWWRRQRGEGTKNAFDRGRGFINMEVGNRKRMVGG